MMFQSFNGFISYGDDAGIARRCRYSAYLGASARELRKAACRVATLSSGNAEAHSLRNDEAGSAIPARRAGHHADVIATTVNNSATGTTAMSSTGANATDAD